MHLYYITESSTTLAKIYKEEYLNRLMCGCFCINKILFTQTYIYLGHLYIGTLNETVNNEEMLLCKNKRLKRNTAHILFSKNCIMEIK